MSKVWLLLAYVILLPLASPFGIGIHAGTTTGTAAPTSRQSKPNHQFSPLIKRLSMPPQSAANRRSIASMQGTMDATSEKIKGQECDEKIIKDDQLRSPLEKIKNPVRRAGAALLYTYVDPLLKTSKVRSLEESDAFQSPAHVNMENQVPKLEKIYSRCKAKAERRNLRYSVNNSRKKSLKSRFNRKVSKSDSLILAKALFLHLKKDIIATGLLRLLNTIIQAFPAILVARLLKLIEAGESAHPSLAIRAALNLVAVLSLKMVVENQYFHSIVKCSTMVRGSLSGMIFDKCLSVKADSDFKISSNMNGKEDNDYDDETTAKESDGRSSSVLNLVMSDVAIIEYASLQIHTIWGE